MYYLIRNDYNFGLALEKVSEGYKKVAKKKIA